MKLSEYLEREGHGAAARLATTIGATPTEISDWSNQKRPVPPHRCVAIERASNGDVSRKDLRPSDWQMYWPELVNDTITNPNAA